MTRGGGRQREEVGGTHGLEALQRLQNVVRRVADQWRPASLGRVVPHCPATAVRDPGREGAGGDPGHGEVVRGLLPQVLRRLPAGGARRRHTRSGSGATYPIHPELFDRLYEDWSTLERFQRTRGVLRLMNTVIYALWVGEDASPLIMPGSIPIATSSVNAELTQYLQDSWKAIIDADVDGPNSEPAKIDTGQAAVRAAVADQAAGPHGVLRRGPDDRVGAQGPGDPAGVPRARRCPGMCPATSTPR